MAISNKIKKDAGKHIKLFALQNAVPNIQHKNKAPYIEYLSKNQPKKLIDLLEHWKTNRYMNLFLFKFSFKDSLTANEIYIMINNMNVAGSKDDELIYEIKKTHLYSDTNDLKLFLHIRSKTKHLSSNKAVMPYSKLEVDHRKPYFINAIYHSKNHHLEVRTSHIKKANEVLDFFTKYVFKKQKFSIEQIKLDLEKITKVDKNAKCTELNINGEYYGAQQIIIRGPDTIRCLNEFKELGANFRDIEGIEIIKCKNNAESLLIKSNLGNGKIQIIKYTEETADPYRYLLNKVGL